MMIGLEVLTALPKEQSSKDKKSGRASNMPPPGPVGVFIGEQVESSVVAGKDIVADEGITIE